MTKIKFTMHDGREMITNIENYNADEIKTMLNDRSEEYVSYGTVGFAKHTVKYYEPVTEEAPVE